jgi:hypothetical protein
MASAKKKPRRPGPEWFTRTEMARVLNVNPRQVDELRERVPEDAIKRVDRIVFLHGRRFLDARDRAVERADERDAEALMTEGADSPAMERFRLARAQLAELELSERTAQVVRLDKLEPAIARFASILRKAGETITRLHGNDAGNVLIEAIDEAVRNWRHMLGPVPAGRDDAAPAEPRPARKSPAPAKHAGVRPRGNRPGNRAKKKP